MTNDRIFGWYRDLMLDSVVFFSYIFQKHSLDPINFLFIFGYLVSKKSSIALGQVIIVWNYRKLQPSTSFSLTKVYIVKEFLSINERP